MNFWDLFWPMFAAIMASAVIMEVFQFGVGVWLAKKQAAHYKKMEEEMAKLYPNGLPLQDLGLGGFNFPMPNSPVVDGATSEKQASNTGQYL